MLALIYDFVSVQMITWLGGDIKPFDLYPSSYLINNLEGDVLKLKRHLHISHNNLVICPLKFCITFVFSIPLGITAIPREIENNAYAKFWGASKVHMGRCQVAYKSLLNKERIGHWHHLHPYSLFLVPAE